MALSKLAISLIAGIGSVAAIGGITAGVVVSRQNTTQTAEISQDDNQTIARNRNESKKTDSNNTGVQDMPLGDDAKAAVDTKADKEAKLKKEKQEQEEAKKKLAEEKDKLAQMKGIDERRGDATSYTSEVSQMKKEQTENSAHEAGDTGPKQEKATPPVKDLERQKEGEKGAGSAGGADSSTVQMQTGHKEEPVEA